MNKVSIEKIHLIGLSLKTKTINANGQSSIDCKNLWHEFEDGKYGAVIPDKLSEEIYGIYHHYEGDSSKPFSYFVGCKVKEGAAVPEGLVSMTIPEGNYHRITVNGKMPDCVINAWKDVWAADYPRSFHTDFEVYDHRCKDWNNAEVDVYLSIKN